MRLAVTGNTDDLATALYDNSMPVRDGLVPGASGCRPECLRYVFSTHANNVAQDIASGQEKGAGREGEGANIETSNGIREENLVPIKATLCTSGRDQSYELRVTVDGAPDTPLSADQAARSGQKRPEHRFIPASCPCGPIDGGRQRPASGGEGPICHRSLRGHSCGHFFVNIEPWPQKAIAVSVFCAACCENTGAARKG